ncbi:MAG: dCTP deaminase [Halobacteria archaeon]|nr:dCTP deaminase [Halobacteria archaeon]
MPSITSYVEGIVHEDTQAHDGVLDITANEIYEVETPGRVDFGGGELENAELTPHEKQKRNPDDDYSWWDLDAGTYVVEYNESLNESLADDERLVLEPRAEIVEKGAFHPTMHITELPKVALTIGGGGKEAGIRIKENARVSTLVLE